VVTGASSDIGRELARVAAREGSFMLLVGRSMQALDDLFAELNATRSQADALSLDLADPTAGEKNEAALQEGSLLRRAR
jgi:uncharacterized protein